MRRISVSLVVLGLPLLMGSTTDFLMGQGRMEAGQHHLAVDAFRDALTERPNSSRAKVGLGKALASQGECVEALKYLGDVRGERVWNSDSILYEAICLYRVGDDAAYLAALEEALVLTPRDPALWLQVSLGLLRFGDLAGAEQAADVVGTLPASELYVMLLDAVVAFEKGAPDADYLIHRLIHRTSNVPSLMLQGLLLDARRWLVLGNPEEANEIIEKVLRMDLRNVAAAGWRAEAFRRLGSPEMALGATARPAIAKAASPLRDAIRIRVLVDLGRLEEAQIALEQHPLPFSVETLASSWYLARALGDDQAVQEAEELWAVINLDAGRQLRSLIPANSEAN